MECIKGKAICDVALSVGAAAVGSAVSAAPGHDKDEGVVIVAGLEVLVAARCHAALHLQVLFELSASRVFTLHGAAGVDYIRCDQGVRPLLQQRVLS